jgi:hypothetical protein
VQPLGITVRSGLHTGEIELKQDDIGGIAGQASQQMETAILETQPRARDEIAHGARHQGFSRPGHCDNASRDIHRRRRIFLAFRVAKPEAPRAPLAHSIAPDEWRLSTRLRRRAAAGAGIEIKVLESAKLG